MSAISFMEMNFKSFIREKLKVFFFNSDFFISVDHDLTALESFSHFKYLRIDKERRDLARSS